MKQEISVFIDKIEESILCSKAQNLDFQKLTQGVFPFKKTLILERCTKLPQSAFVKPELLKKNDLEKVMARLEILLEHLGLSVGFPRSLPLKLKYSFLFSIWASGTVAFNSEGIIEVCNYNIEACPFPGFCRTCEEMASRIRMDEQLQRGGFDEVDEIS